MEQIEHLGFFCSSTVPRNSTGVKVMWSQYFCVGMSLWDNERMKQNSKEARSPTDPVELPYCEGLEVISASQLQQNPVVLTNNAGATSTSEPARPQSEGPPQKCVPIVYHIRSQSHRRNLSCSKLHNHALMWSSHMRHCCKSSAYIPPCMSER